MKYFIRTGFILLAAVMALSCTGKKEKNKVASHGKAYEVIVICAQDKWEGEFGDTLRNILLEDIGVLNSREPMFDVMRIVPNSFSGLITKHHNIINVNIGDPTTVPQMTAVYDVYAAPQLIVNIIGPDPGSATQYISENRAELQAIFNMAERDRYTSQLQRYGDKQLERVIKDKFDFTVNLPRGFKERSSMDDFMWLSYEYPQASQGLIIYTYPYTGAQDFTADSLFSKRNLYVARVPGENPGSYMTTFPDFYPELTHLRINGRYWAELRGFWDVKGDFMGGPFVSYSTIDVANNMVVTIDCYIYSPSPYKHKRNYLRQLENLMYNVKFPGDND